jgi:glycosyltransferase involved in cell wall biosynthesis
LKVIIFGTGELYQRNLKLFSDIKIIALIDNDSNKWNTYINGIKVISPNMIFQYHFDYILLVSKYYKDMRQQLLDLGIKEELILDREHTKISGMRVVTKYENIGLKRFNKRILLITHSLVLTGAPLMLFNLAQILFQNGYDIVVYSLTEGELLYEFVKKGIPVTIFKDFEFNEKEKIYYFNEFDLIIANTVTLYRLVLNIESLNIPIVWWLHEEDNIYDAYNIKESDLVHSKNVFVYGVSDRAIRSYYKYSNKHNIKKLVYGIEQHPESIRSKRKKDKIVFAVIGSVDKRKAQDVFANAIDRNWERWKSFAEFWIIGCITEEQKLEYIKMNKIKIWGALEHDELMNIYPDINVVVCPSRNDPLPVVLAEGMMHKKVCIASDMTGTAEYIEPYKNGLICKAGDIDSLSESIQWVIEHKKYLKEIGEKAFGVYDKFFSMSQFRENILEIVAKALERKEDYPGEL